MSWKCYICNTSPRSHLDPGDLGCHLSWVVLPYTGFQQRFLGNSELQRQLLSVSTASPATWTLFQQSLIGFKRRRFGSKDVAAEPMQDLRFNLHAHTHRQKQQLGMLSMGGTHTDSTCRRHWSCRGACRLEKLLNSAALLAALRHSRVQQHRLMGCLAGKTKEKKNKRKK